MSSRDDALAIAASTPSISANGASGADGENGPRVVAGGSLKATLLRARRTSGMGGALPNTGRTLGGPALGG